LGALLLALLIVIVLFVVGFAVVKFLIWVAIILAILWLIGFFVRGVDGASRRPAAGLDSLVGARNRRLVRRRVRLRNRRGRWRRALVGRRPRLVRKLAHLGTVNVERTQGRSGGLA